MEANYDQDNNTLTIALSAYEQLSLKEGKLLAGQTQMPDYVSAITVEADEVRERAEVVLPPSDEVAIFITRGFELPLTIPNENIKAPFDVSRGRIERYFGKTGHVALVGAQE